ncbi:MAG: class I mannose-6-phosphate isomerase [Firmicutes bacterium]|nr:class I mannose-6-phosphate isomerase [Bacillota bacterium]
MTEIQKWQIRLKETVWAGERMFDLFGREHIGEAYLFSGSVDFLRERGISVAEGALPLIKYIDVGAPLSVQVHPCGARGKDELWIVDEVTDRAAVYIGFSRDTSKEEILDGCENGTILSLMRRFPVAKGDIFWIPGGTVHCAEGISFFEVQNERDVTYRLYDHGRKRELQREDALCSADTSSLLSVSVRKTAKEIEGLFPFRCVLCEESAPFGDETTAPCVYTMMSEASTFCGEKAPLGTSFFVPKKTLVRGRGPYLKTEWISVGEDDVKQRLTL